MGALCYGSILSSFPLDGTFPCPTLRSTRTRITSSPRITVKFTHVPTGPRNMPMSSSLSRVRTKCPSTITISSPGCKPAASAPMPSGISRIYKAWVPLSLPSTAPTEPSPGSDAHPAALKSNTAQRTCALAIPSHVNRCLLPRKPPVDKVSRMLGQSLGQPVGKRRFTVRPPIHAHKRQKSRFLMPSK